MKISLSAPSAKDIAPLMISEKVPGTIVTSISGEDIPLTDVVSQQRSVILYYRGGWCPYCNVHLSDIGLIEQELIALGYQIIGISPDSPEKLKESQEKEMFKCDLYSDSDGSLMMNLGIAFEAPERYHGMLKTVSGQRNPGYLPVPSLFVVDTDGTILFEYVSPDFKQRISADLLLDVVKRLEVEMEE